MASITHGREIPDSDRERIAAELKKFDAKVAAWVLRELSVAIRDHKNGFVRMIVKITDGRFTTGQVQTDFTEGLDGSD